jgi:predicted nucleotidyltransferase
MMNTPSNISLALSDRIQAKLASWAARNDAVAELWLFGSRANGTSRPDSDVDVGLALMPADSKHDWALGAFYALESEWKAELEAIAGCHVSVVAMVPGTKAELVVRGTGALLWKRVANSADAIKSRQNT